MKRNILVVAPHCDDEVLGCGGTIARYASEGHTIFVVIVTNGHIGAPELFSKEGTENNRVQAKRAISLLGAKDLFFLDFPAPMLDTIPSYKISLALSEIIRKNQIDTIYVPHSGDIHRDHVITCECSLVAARPINNCSVKRIYAYETLSETEWAIPLQNQAFVPTVFVDITKQLKKKKEAFALYTLQAKTFPHPRSMESIECLAMRRGVTVGVPYAEAFMLIREII